MKYLVVTVYLALAGLNLWVALTAHTRPGVAWAGALALFMVWCADDALNDRTRK